MGNNIKSVTYGDTICFDETKITIKDIKELVLDKYGVKIYNNNGGTVTIPINTILEIIGEYR